MEKIMKGKPVADKLTGVLKERAATLTQRGKTPCLAILRVGENPGDMAYERGACKRAEEIGVSVRQYVYDADVQQEKLLSDIRAINYDDSIDGVLIFRPLPETLDEAEICEALAPEKDVDGITTGSMAGVFMGEKRGYPPCTAAACMELLRHYGVDLKGKRVTVMGRSLVIGKPVAMMAMGEHATVTVCHSRTRKEDFDAAGKQADVVVAALGKAKMVGKSSLGENQVIIDVGINVDENQKLCGDVNYDEVEGIAAGITPVPGGVGSVTTAVLMKHVIDAAELAFERAGK